MDIFNKLASVQGRKDEVPNQELAHIIAKNSDKSGVEEVIGYLSHKSKGVQQDAIKVLYEIGEHKPELIAPYLEQFMQLLTSKNNRMQWGGMTALHYITPLKPAEIYDHIAHILEVADQGSVITRDHAVNILIALASVSEYTENALSLLAEQLLTSPENQLAMYAERTLPVVNTGNKERFAAILKDRLGDIEKESRKKRIERVIKKLS